MRALLILLALSLLAFLSLASFGGGLQSTAAAALITLLSPAPLLALAYILGGLGLGSLFRRVVPDSREAQKSLTLATIRGALGLTTLLTYSHLLGTVGGFSHGYSSVALAWLPIAAGVALLSVAGKAAARLKSLTSLLTSELFTDESKSALVSEGSQGGQTLRLHRFSLLLILPAAVLLLAACNAPGYLWESEFGGYDALSYHLQLPVEWSANGRLWPLQNNVYSFLPSYAEAANYHLAALMHATSPASPLVTPLQASIWPISCQFLHAAFTLFAAWCIGVAANTALHCSGLVPRAAPGRPTSPSPLPLLAGALALATPWTVVIGSLAYNEMPMLAFFAASVACALYSGESKQSYVPGDEPLPPHPLRSPILRSMVCAVLLGGAIGCKPTGLIFCAVPIAILLFGTFRREGHRWPTIAAAASVAAVTGLAMLTPWLARNYWASGNPVFPFAAHLFPSANGGTGHWNSEQVKRYLAGHHFSGSLLQSLRLMFLPDPTDPAGARHRGLMHPQWLLFFPAVFAAVVAIALTSGRVGSQTDKNEPRKPSARRSAFRWSAASDLVAVFMLQLGLWLRTTHVQSRFLIPLLVTGSLIVIIATSRLARWRGAERQAQEKDNKNDKPDKPDKLDRLDRLDRLDSLDRQVRWPTIVVTAIVIGQSVGLTYIFLSQRNWRPNALLAITTADRTGDSLRPALAAPFDRSQSTAQLLDNFTPEQTINLLLPPNARVHIIGGATPFYYVRPVRYQTTWDTWPSLNLDGSPQGVDAGDFLLVDFAEIDRLQRSGTLQPGFNIAQLSAWLQRSSQPLRTWPATGQVLVQVGQALSGKKQTPGQPPAPESPPAPSN